MSILRLYNKLSLGSRIYISTGLGLLLGMFFSDYCSLLENVNTLFIRIFQIPIIPYMIFSIVYAIGSLSISNAKTIWKKGVIILFVLWAVSIFYALVLKCSFPDIERSKFFCPPDKTSTSNAINFIDLFIPYNPFFSMANGYIPAIVIFCALIGIALIREENKITLVKYIGILTDLMKKVNDYVIQLLPFGILVISTYTFGTLSLVKLKGLLLYIIVSIFYLVFISLIVYPWMLSSIGEISYRKFLHYSMPAALISFTTGNVFLALPVIYDLMTKFIDKEFDTSSNICEGSRNKEIIGIIVPLAWVVPASHKFLIIFFIVFTSWYYDKTLNFLQEIVYYIGMIPCLFGGSSIIVPFLLEMSSLPNKAYNDFLIISNFLTYFNNANAAIFIIVCTILCCTSISGKTTKIHWRKLLLFFTIGTLVFYTSVIGVNMFMSKYMSGSDEVKQELMHMNIHLYSESWYSKINVAYLGVDAYRPLISTNPEASLLERILLTKTLQVGYNSEAIPLSFFNNSGMLVGFDIDFIYMIAQNLGCNRIEFYPISSAVTYEECLNKQIKLAICVGGYINRPPFGKIIASEPYMKVTPALVIPDKRKKQYADFDAVCSDKNIKIGIHYGTMGDKFIDDIIKQHHLMPLNHINDFYVDKKCDALLILGELASAINILHTGYSVYYYPKQDLTLFFSYLMPFDPDSESFRNYINSWIGIWFKYGIQKQRYKYWIMGEGNVKQEKSRSIL